MAQINIKRTYEPASPSDGYRIFIDRLWPRGLSHEDFKYDLWDKNIAPSSELREWYHADPDNRWTSFEAKYEDEIKNNPDFQQLKDIVSKHKVITLLYSSHDEKHNNAIVLQRLLES